MPVANASSDLAARKEPLVPLTSKPKPIQSLVQCKHSRVHVGATEKAATPRFLLRYNKLK